MAQHEGCERLWHSTRAAHGCETWRCDWGSDVCDLSSAEAARLGLSSAKMKIWALLVTSVTQSVREQLRMATCDFDAYESWSEDLLEN